MVSLHPISDENFPWPFDSIIATCSISIASISIWLPKPGVVRVMFSIKLIEESQKSCLSYMKKSLQCILVCETPFLTDISFCFLFRDMSLSVASLTEISVEVELLFHFVTDTCNLQGLRSGV